MSTDPPIGSAGMIRGTHGLPRSLPLAPLLLMVLTSCSSEPDTRAQATVPAQAAVPATVSQPPAGSHISAFTYERAGLTEAGCLTADGKRDSSLSLGDSQCIRSLWTTSQIERAVNNKDCAILPALQTYVSGHGELEHDGPQANYVDWQIKRLC